MTTLTPAQRKRAIEAIENMARMQPELAASKERIESQEQGASAHIYGLAQYAAQVGRDNPRELFQALCKHAEETYKGKLGIKNLKDALPVWAMFKSNIQRGLKLGLNPADHPNEYQFRKAMRTIVKEKAAPKEPTPAEPKEVQDFLGTTTIVPALAMLLARLTLAAEYVKPTKRREAEQVLKETAERMQGFVDQKRIRDEATRQAVVIEFPRQEAAA